MVDHLSPLSAVTAADPYPYYLQLVETVPFAFNESVGAWVAASAAAVEEALLHPRLGVRPPSEPTPNIIRGTALGDAFGRLARMNDGEAHRRLRASARSTIEKWSLETVGAVAASCAGRRAREIDSTDDLNAYTYDMPAMSMATLLSIDHHPDALRWIRNFARAIAPGASAAEFKAGSTAAQELQHLLTQRMDEGEAAACLGFLFQTYDATAGLIAGVFAHIVAMRATPDASDLDELLAFAVRYDSPVHNTRRYAASDLEIAGVRVSDGDTILVLLAAANRDPQGTQSFTFGLGAHACLGARTAQIIAHAGVHALVERFPDTSGIGLDGYRPSLNCRIPAFAVRR